MSGLLAPGHGTITPYTGGSRRRRQRGYCTVREPAKGFFIAGSDIDRVNGLYVRRNCESVTVTQSLDLDVGLAYVNDKSGWLMTMARSTKANDSDEDEHDMYERRTIGGRGWYWFFVDVCGKCLFQHEGDTIIPGSGTRWIHCTDESVAPESSDTATSLTAKASVDALPWQVIALLDSEIVWKLRMYQEAHSENIQRAIAGEDLKRPDVGSIEAIYLRAGKKERSLWLWRVVADEGCHMHLKPTAASRIDHLTPRRRGSYLVVVRRQSGWLAVRPSGNAEMREIDRLTYFEDKDEDEDEGVGREMWIRVKTEDGVADVEEISESRSPCFDSKPFDDPKLSHLFDRPFEPRILGAELSETSTTDDDDDEDEDGDDDEDDDAEKVESDDRATHIATSAANKIDDDEACPTDIADAIADLRAMLARAKNADVEETTRIRLTIVRLRRDGEAAKEAAAVAETSETSDGLLYLGKCLLRTGDSARGMVRIRASHEHGNVEASMHLKAFRIIKRNQSLAHKSYIKGDFKKAAAFYTEALSSQSRGLQDDKQTRATLLTSRAACYRRSREFKRAIEDCDFALDLFPSFTRALFRRGACLMESGHPQDALSTFERLLRFDRDWPDLVQYLVRATAVLRRLKKDGSDRDERSSEAKEGEKKENASSPAMPSATDYYVALGISTDATAKQLKRAFRLMSLRFHPDRKGGSTKAFQRIREAYETLSDPDLRRQYDAGVDTKRKPRDRDDDDYEDDEDEEQSLWEEVERKYFPERYKFHPFGDPLIEKRKSLAREAKRRCHREGWGF